MRWRFSLAVLLGLSIANAAPQAQGQPADEGSSSASASPIADGYFASRGVVRFQLIAGRLRLDPPRHRKGSQQRDSGGVYENITVTAERGIPSLHYVCHTPVQQLTLSVREATELKLESWLSESGERSILLQPEYEPLTWEISGAGTTRRYRGASLLHVRAEAPRDFDRHFAQIMTCMLRGRSLAVVNRRTRAALLRKVTAVQAPGRSEVCAAVDRLRADKRRLRVEAERQLLEWGSVILPVVRTLPADRLDPEQAARLRRIRRELRPPVEDTAASLATLLVRDQTHWDLLAGELTAEQVARINPHLDRLGLTPIRRDAIAGPAGQSDGDGGETQFASATSAESGQ